MDKLSLCLNFVPMLDDENPNASFMRESIDTYSDVMLDELIDEGFKDVLGSIGKKIKSGAKSAWNAIKDTAVKIGNIAKSFFQHMGKSGNINESIIAILGSPKNAKVGKTAEDYIKGIKLGLQVIEDNIDTYYDFADIAISCMNKIKSENDFDKSYDLLVKNYHKACERNAERIAKRAKAFGIQESDKVSHLEVAAQLMSKRALSMISSSNAKELKEIARRLSSIRERMEHVDADFLSPEGTALSTYQKIKTIGAGSFESDASKKFKGSIVYIFKDICNDFDYTIKDFNGMYNRIAYAHVQAGIAKTQNEAASIANESVAPRNIMYRLGESEVYRTARSLDTVDGATLESNITRMVRDGHGFTFVSLNDLDKTVLYDIFEANQYFNVGVSGAKRAMKNLLGTGKVQMVFSDVCFIDVSIPYVVTMGRSPRVFVNISHFVSRNDQGKYEIKQPRNRNGFMAAIFAACVTYAILSHYHVLSPEIGDPIVLMYSYMLTDVIDRIVHADAITREKVRYLATEFALIQMYGTEAGNKQFQRFRTKFFPKLSPMIMDSIDAQFSLDAFDTLPKMIEELVRIYPSMKKLNFKQVWVNWQKKFGQATLFSIDYMGYMIYTMAMLLYESPLVYRLALDPMLKSARGESALKLLQTMVASVG